MQHINREIITNKFNKIETKGFEAKKKKKNPPTF